MAADNSRRELLERMQEDLLGPLKPDEVLDCRPSDRYLTGILYAERSETPPEEQEAETRFVAAADGLHWLA